MFDRIERGIVSYATRSVFPTIAKNNSFAVSEATLILYRFSGTSQTWVAMSGGSSGVLTVTGLNTNNTDPTNPIVQISVDGVTITGLGTPANPLVGVSSGGTPAGSDMYVQYNDSGAFGADVGLQWDYNNGILIVGYQAGTGYIQGPDATTLNFSGGSLSLQTGFPNGNGNGGDLQLFCASATNGNGGSVSFSGGSAGGTSHQGGSITFDGGNGGTGNSPGGLLAFTAGAGGTTGGAGGDCSLSAGGANGGNANGGSVYLFPGLKSGSGTSGVVKLADPVSTKYANLLTSSLTADRNFTFPNVAGVLAINPMTTSGDMIYGGTSGVSTRLAPSTAGYFLQTNGSGVAPSWVNLATSFTATCALYSKTMTGDFFTVTASFSNVAGGGMAIVGNGTTIPYVQVTSVVINATTDVVDITFSALAIPSATADLLVGYQIDSDTAVWGTYTKCASTFMSILNETTTGLSVGTHTIKLMACKAGTGNVDIGANDSTTFGDGNVPSGAIFRVKVFGSGSFTNPMTTVGDIIYGGVAGVPTRLADVATGNVLLSGGVGVAPAYGQVGLTTHVTGTLPFANGGTGVASWTQYLIPYAATTTSIGQIAIGSSGQVLTSNGAGAAPTFQAAAGGGLTVGTTTIASGSTTNLLYNNAGVLGEYTISGTGTVVAMQTAPTFITSITDPLLIGGTGTTQTLILRSTSGVGAAGADIIFQAGNNGALEVGRFLNNGRFGIAVAAPAAMFDMLVNTSTVGVKLTGTALAAASGSLNATHASLMINATGTTGQEYSGSTNNRRGGSGGGHTFTGGTGGAHTGSGTGTIQATAVGGGITFTGGDGGVSTGAGGAIGGTGGSVQATTGFGGDSSFGNGGTGGSFSFTSGTGGGVVTSGKTGGTGGGMQFVCGGGGTATNAGANTGTGGVLSFDAGRAGTALSGANAVGTVGGITFGFTSASSIGFGNTTDNTIINFITKFTKYGNVATTGWGVPAIYGTGRSIAQTAAVASVAAYTVGAADGSFWVSANILVTTSTVHSFTATVAYTDEGNTARTVTMQFSTLAGAFVTAMTNAQGTVPYEGVPLHIRCKAATAITIATAGTFTTVTYNVEGTISQIA